MCAPITDAPGTKLWNGRAAGHSRWTPAAIAAARRGEWEIVLTPTGAIPALVSALARRAGALPGRRRRATRPDPGRCRRRGHRLRQLTSTAGPGSLRGPAGESGVDHRRRRHGGPHAPLPMPASISSSIPARIVFVPAVRPVWQEAYRVLRKGGALLAGFCNPGHVHL